MSVEIGKHIREKRNERGWTQERLAKEIGLDDYHQIGKFENGKVQIPTKRLYAIARAFQIDISELTGASPPVKKPPGVDVVTALANVLIRQIRRRGVRRLTAALIAVAVAQLIR